MPVQLSLVEMADQFEAAISKPTRCKDLPPAPTDAPLLTRAEVAALLRTSPQHVSNMIGRGQIVAPLKLPGLGLRWKRAELLAWLGGQR